MKPAAVLPLPTGAAASRAQPAGPARCLGLDPGLNRTGYAVLELTPRGPRLVEGGVLKSNPDDPLSVRVAEIGGGVRELIREFAPRLIAVEQVFAHGRNYASSLKLAHCRGAILLAAGEEGVPVEALAPTAIKARACGNGRADKAQMQRSVSAELGLKAVLEPNDVADAAAAALCVFGRLRAVAA
ncbi:crossover junction endodeoxyribonuclease RuvC [Alienimonas californiensis]|uniref:Crossover junction endodeoxyribonuclease RuvC n=1 Tax=Alienimonas californiensis TaxID=2527989 RepID=A0A517PFM7_9PLAN|nr:crossover junction endodeoxyribonuclease RuvC [Alienimonas californiensis]QDT18193.1 Crossover junction endodeoxyribonuclease RuvC [Alienimonas californiensis]